MAHHLPQVTPSRGSFRAAVSDALVFGMGNGIEPQAGDDPTFIPTHCKYSVNPSLPVPG